MPHPISDSQPSGLTTRGRFRNLSQALLSWGLGVLLQSAGAAEPLHPAQPYTAAAVDPATHNVELMVTVTAPYKTKQLRVWMPIPPSDTVQQLVSSNFSTFPDEVKPQIATEPVYGNKFAYFEFSHPQGAMVIRHTLQVKVAELHWNLDPAKVQTTTQWPENFASYLSSESQAVVADARFEKLLAEIVSQRKNPLLDLGRVMHYADQNFQYDHKNASLQASSLHALNQNAGHCSDYHGFCAAMGRLLQQPTRVTYGINTFPKASPSHCKLEAFLAPYGWVSFDVSETQKMAALIRADAQLSDAEKDSLVTAAQARLTSGFRDNTWFKQTQGTDYDLAPRASKKVAVVRTIYAEADGVALPEPDPSAPGKTQFAWMTSHRFQSTPPVQNPFTNLDSLRK
ncbi:MAG: transglutaminase domain-containing protein [Planctomycetota bacterium]|nr:MAG: transglutaminase domain-containing protein [Planctomycetota bacterium]